MDAREILCDTRQHAGKHENKMGWWASNGVHTRVQKLDFGDYMVDGSNVSVDTKRNVAEIAQNIGGKNHQRFREECKRAQNAGYRLVVLVENEDGYERLEHVCQWTNTHCTACKQMRLGQCDPHDASAKCARHGTRKPIQGERLAKAMHTMQQRYGVRFEFCRPSDSAERICELLGVAHE